MALNMVIDDSPRVRKLFAERREWLTIEQIAKEMGMSTRTISKAFSGHTMRLSTVKKLADAIQEKPTSIAKYIDSTAATPPQA